MTNVTSKRCSRCYHPRMRLIEQLVEEHERIDRTLGAFRTWAGELAEGRAPREDGTRFIAFFELYAGRFHHEREEEVLFTTLASKAEVPRERGPIAVLTADHRDLESRLAKLRSLLPIETSKSTETLRDLVYAYTEALWTHIDAENSVLFPESESRLRRNGVRELDGRAPSVEELALAADAEALAVRYPPGEDAGVIRGEGCVMCAAYGDRCAGIEREWWGENEWDEFDEHIGAS
ncbi:MAG: hemerythrin domain-containing protein [Thermoanaerobaculia bacterium]